MFITTILLLLSLLLHVVAFYFIVVLFTKLSSMKSVSDNQRKVLEEAENSMTSFLIEMKDENDRLIEHFRKQDSTNNLPDKEENVRTTDLHMEPIDRSKAKSEHATSTQDNTDKLPVHLGGIEDVQDIVEIKERSPITYKTPEEEALSLYEQGLTIEQIAKKLKKGKTEIELLVKFRQNEREF
ncbi:hypothetical protein ACNRWW_09105 [Metabacillus sp. HB246100]